MVDPSDVLERMRAANPAPSLEQLAVDDLDLVRNVVARGRSATTTPVKEQPQIRPDRVTPRRAPTRPRIQAAPVTSPPPQRRRKAWAFAVAFILVVVAVGLAALVTRDGDHSPVADEPMAPVTVTTPSSTTAAPHPIDIQSLTWTRVPHDEAVFNPTTGVDVMSSIAEGGPGFVAVGTTGGVEELERDAAVWICEDGISWSRVPNDAPPLGGPTAQEMESVTVGGPGLVAVGLEWEYPLSPVAVVWTSEDGMSWSRVTHNEAAFEGARMDDVTAGGPGLVAVGGTGLDAAVWTSTDGVAWTRVRLSPEATLWPDTDGAMKGVAAGGPGLVAVGFAGRDPEGTNAAVWTSPDGLTWSRIPHDERVFAHATMSDVTAGGPGLVAVGAAGHSPAVWTSADGYAWTRVPPETAIFGSDGIDERSMNAITSIGTQLVAVGGAGDKHVLPPTPASFVWTSVDGTTWTPIELNPGDWVMHGVIATSQRVVAVGQEAGAATVWVATEG